MSTVYVNEKWTDESAFSADAEKPADAVWGVNVFSDFSSAYEAAAAGDTVRIISGAVFTGNTAGSSANTWNKNVDIIVVIFNKYRCVISNTITYNWCITNVIKMRNHQSQ